jgi:hypothetical protein
MADYEYRPRRPERNEPAFPNRGGGPVPPKPVPPPSNAIVVTQKNPPQRALAHSETRKAVIPHLVMSAPASLRLNQIDVSADIHEFLFEVKKAGSVFWVGAAVRKDATDFTQAQVFFHPTVKQGNTTHAEEGDYREFKGGWSKSLQRYVADHGTQFAAAGKRYPLLVPFTTMAALSDASKNMFTDRPLETLNTIVHAIQDLVLGEASGGTALSAIGAGSFSSGIMALRSFVAAMASSRLVKEVIDFDSPFITREAKQLTMSPGAVSKCFTQHVLAHPPMGWVTVTGENFKGVTEFQKDGLHAQIGWLMYHQAMITSTL